MISSNTAHDRRALLELLRRRKKKAMTWQNTTRGCVRSWDIISITQATDMNHQFSLYGYMPPKKKISSPGDVAKIKRARELAKAGDHKGAAEILREFRERLEDKYGV
jgi:hypothetical protein